MSLIQFKIIAIFIIFTLTLITGLLPLRLATHHKKIFSIGDAFASGIFLSAALMHLLPESDKGLGALWGVDFYPVAHLICMLTFVALLLMERGVAQYGRSHLPNCNSITPYLLTSVLVLHSLVEGVAIGITDNLAKTGIIFCAVIAHKGSESFALATNLRRYNLTLKNISRIIVWFACATPVGIFISSFTQHLLHTNTGVLLESIFNAIAAGTFLYLGTMHTCQDDHALGHKHEMAALVVGVAVMASIAILI